MNDVRNCCGWWVLCLLVSTVLIGCVEEKPVPSPTVSATTAPPVEPLPPSELPTVGPQRAPIYDVEADGAELIAAALERAQLDNKRVLIEWGGNWCGWCYKLHNVFQHDEQVRPLVFEEYELVLIDERNNHDLMESYGGQDRQYSYPHLTILDANGEVLVNQNTEPLEDGPQHDPAKVAAFLTKWAPTPLDAETLLASALEQATAQDKCVLVHVGTPYCGWCRVLSGFLHDHESQLASDLIDLKIDTKRMTHGEDVAKRFQPEGSLGIPWMVILDGSGQVLATSVGPEGNCGYPYQPPEIDHFITMLSTARKRMTDDDLAVIRSDLEAYRNEREQE